MSSKLLYRLLFTTTLFFSLLLISCDDDPSEPSKPTGPGPYIDKVINTNTFAGAGIVIEGGNFGNMRGSSYVSVNGKSIKDDVMLMSWNDTRITITLPGDAKSGEVKVHTSNGTSNGIKIIIGEGPADGEPKLDYIDVKRAQPGQSIGLNGSNFGSGHASNYVQFNNDSSKTFAKWTDGLIIVQVPEYAKSGKVFVYVNGKISNSLDFNVQDPNYVLDMVPIYTNNTEFIMGYEDPDTAWDAAKHTVLMTRDFYMSETEVTQEQWANVMSGSNPSRFALGDDHPVEQVSFLRAVEFCNTLSRMEGKPECYQVVGSGSEAFVACDFTVDGYRLPTEAEWEFACRAGTDGDFGGTGILSEMGWYNGNADGKHKPVKQKKPNDFGLYDMHGNVTEWVWDYYDATYYMQFVGSKAVDPEGPELTDTRERVRRGGSAWDGKENCTSSIRVEALGQTIYNFDTGFRVARTKLR